MNKNKRIIIADINSADTNGICSGHYIPVAKMYHALFEKETSVSISGGPIYNKYFPKEDRVDLPFNINGESIVDRIKNIINCISLFWQSKGSIVIMQQCRDVITYLSIALFYRCRNSKLFLIRYSDKSIQKPFSRFLYNCCKNKVDGIICPSKELGEKYGINYLAIPDYIYIEESSVSITTPIPYNDRKYDFSMVGRIAPGKGVVEAAQKFANTRYSVLIAGKAENKQLEQDLLLACQNAHNIDLRLGYVNDEDYHYFHINSKYTVLNYQGEYSIRSSGAVFDTLFSGVPVVGCDCDALHFIKTEGLGYIYDTIEGFNPDSVLSSDLYSQYQTNILSYKQTHNQYRKQLVDFILHSK